MFNRRKFIQASFLAGFGGILSRRVTQTQQRAANYPVVISTWDVGMEANKAAWQVLSGGGRALDAVEKGVMVTEASQNCCVGLGGYPDRDGIVTLDACIMDEFANCGSVAFLERIKHPIAVARKVMEKTPHVMLVGSGAQQFALAEGFPLEESKLSPAAQKAYDNWLKESSYRPVDNSMNTGSSPVQPEKPATYNHDTIGMVAMDEKGNLSGSCTTSGIGFKMHGRVGDSPLIGAGLFVDNEVGACTATGQGEDVIRVAGSHTVIEYMRQGFSPEAACRKTIERIVKIKGSRAKDIQVAFIALNKNGQMGAFALQPGFRYAVKNHTMDRLVDATSWYR